MNKIWISLALGAVLLSNTSRADVVYSDTFEGSSTTFLNGQTTTTGGGTWVAANSFDTSDRMVGFLANGSVGRYSPGAAYLAYDFQDGYIYTVTVDVSVGGTTTDRWGGLTFTTATDLGAEAQKSLQSNSTANLTWALRGLSGGTSLWTGPSTSGAAHSTWYTSTAGTLKIVLDTSVEGNWTYSVYLNDNQPIAGAPYNGTYSGDAFTGVGLYMSSGSVTFDNFSLDATPIPEASTTGLLLGLLIVPALLWARRRFR